MRLCLELVAHFKCNHWYHTKHAYTHVRLSVVETLILTIAMYWLIVYFLKLQCNFKHNYLLHYIITIIGNKRISHIYLKKKESIGNISI